MTVPFNSQTPNHHHHLKITLTLPQPQLLPLRREEEIVVIPPVVMLTLVRVNPKSALLLVKLARVFLVTETVKVQQLPVRQFLHLEWLEGEIPSNITFFYF